MAAWVNHQEGSPAIPGSNVKTFQQPPFYG